MGSIAIPNSVTNIGDCAFYECTGMRTVTIGNKLKKIGNGAFSNCLTLNSVIITGDTPELGSSVFDGHNESARVYYMPGTEGWGTTFGGLPTIELTE